ncbi:MAG: hypothetical protein HY286_03470 [Planctomycetes bacterium]|nr:hypothetical protein [Planctomycetota bacterium]
MHPAYFYKLPSLWVPFFIALFVSIGLAQAPCRVSLDGTCQDMIIGETQVLNVVARPQGGTFQWTATAGGNLISPNSSTDPTFVFDAVDSGFVVLSCTYTTSLGCNATISCSFRIYRDSDGDGIPDPYDDCPYLYDPDQQDSDGDGVPDICEPAANCVISDLILMQASSDISFATVENTGLVGDTFGYELYQSGFGTFIDIDHISGNVTLNPGDVADIPYLFTAQPGAPEGVAEFTFVVTSSAGKIVTQCIALIAVLAAPPPPPACKVDIIVHTPKVINGAEPAVLDNKEDDPGVTTFLNNDNDNHNENYDLGEDDMQVDGENEMVKTVLRIQPPTLNAGNLKLKATKGDTNIFIWKKANKVEKFANTTNITIPVNTLVKSADNKWLETTVWVEGIVPHNAPLGTVLELSYDQDASCKDTASITVMGVKTMNWLGNKNGYTPGSNAFNSDTLDSSDPNFPAGALKTFAVFPDGRSKDVTGVATDAPDKVNDKVKLEVELTCAPPEKFDLYVRALDIDDPSTETGFIDPNDAGGGGNYSGTLGNVVSGGTLNYDVDEDNRGRVDGKKAGKLTGQNAQGVAKMTYAAGATKQTIEFQVSQFPGDNYRVAAHIDRKFLEELRNLDQTDGLEIVHPDTADLFSGDPIPYGLPYSSHVLTVWRMLHVERDSMKALTEAQNQASGAIEAINGGTNVFTIASTGVIMNGNLEPALDFTDKSPAPGRFEKGKMISLAQLATAFDIASNNGTSFTMKAAVQPPCALSKGAANAVSKVTDLSFNAGNGKSTVTVTGPLTANQFNDGTITIGMQAFNVESNTATTVLLKGKATLDFIAVDDDTAGLLPEPNLANTGHMIEAYSGAYIWPVFDGGGKSGADTKDANAAPNVPKIENLATYVAEIQGFFKIDSGANEKDPFWVVYALSCYQYSYLEDVDPFDPENGTGGIVPGGTLSANNLAKGGSGCTVNLETVDDRLNKANDPADKADAGLEARIVAHEIGHQFGLAHNTGVMLSSQQKGPDVGQPFQFSNKDKNLLRSHKKSPGQ